jgi:GT2 family glycosyltransferase
MTADSPPVTLCIINYNGARYLRDALQATESFSRGFSEILLIDNASTDDSLDLVGASFPHVKIIRLSKNKGPGAARNAGFAAATFDLILFQDNDVRLQMGCTEQLLSVLEQESRALLVAPRVVYERNPDVVQYDSADCHFLGLMALRNCNCSAVQADATRGRTTSLVTACFLIDRRRWTGGQLFDEDFFFNLEDHDFGLRANLQGLETWVEPHAVVRHGEGTVDLSYRPGDAVAARRTYYLIRNRWLIIGKCYATRTLLLMAPLLLTYEIFQLGGVIRKGWIVPWWRAVRSLLGGIRPLLGKRAAVQSTRKVPDGKLLQNTSLPFTAAVRSGQVERIAVTLFEWLATGYWKMVRAFI